MLCVALSPVALCVLLLVTFSILLVTLLGIVRSVAGGILRLAPLVLDFALDLLRSALYLRLSIAGPFTGLALKASCRFISLAFDSILIHMLYPFRPFGPCIQVSVSRLELLPQQATVWVKQPIYGPR